MLKSLNNVVVAPGAGGALALTPAHLSGAAGCSRRGWGVISIRKFAVASGARHLSRRDLVGIGGMGSDRVRTLLSELEARGFVVYPKGRNDPGGAVWTAKGRALSRALIG